MKTWIVLLLATTLGAAAQQNLVTRRVALPGFAPAGCGHFVNIGHGTDPVGQVGKPISIVTLYQNLCTCGDYHRFESATQQWSVDGVGVGGTGNVATNTVGTLFTNDAAFMIVPIGSVTIGGEPLLLAPGVGVVVTNFATSAVAGLFVSRAEIAGSHFWDQFGNGTPGPTGASIGSETAVMLPKLRLSIGTGPNAGNLVNEFHKPASISTTLQISSDLVNWTNLYTFPAGIGRIFYGSFLPREPQRFYRLTP